MWRKMVSRIRTVRMRSEVRVSWNKAHLPNTLSCPVISRGSASIDTKSVHRPQGKPGPCGRSTRTQPKFSVRSVKFPGSTCVESHVISSSSSLSSPPALLLMPARSERGHVTSPRFLGYPDKGERHTGMPRFAGHAGQRRMDFSIMLCKSIGVVDFQPDLLSSRLVLLGSWTTRRVTHEVKMHTFFECPISFF